MSFIKKIFIHLRLSRPEYKSDATLLIESLKKSDPDLEKKQREGRSIHWDKSGAYETSKQNATVNTSHPAYKYYDSAPSEKTRKKHTYF